MPLYIYLFSKNYVLHVIFYVLERFSWWKFTNNYFKIRIENCKQYVAGSYAYEGAKIAGAHAKRLDNQYNWSGKVRSHPFVFHKILQYYNLMRIATF